MTAHPRDRYRSLMADRSCSQDDARPHALLGRGLHEKQSNSLRQSSRAPLPPPGASTPNDLRHIQFGQISTCPVLGFRGKGLFSILQKNGTLWSQQPDQVLGDLFRNSGLVTGTCPNPGGSVGLTRGLSSKPGTNPKLLCSDWSLYHEC